MRANWAALPGAYMPVARVLTGGAGLAIAAATAAEWWSYRHDLPPGLGAMIEAPAVCYAREVTLTLQRVPFLRSRLYFPQLLDEGRAAKRSTAPNRTLAAR